MGADGKAIVETIAGSGVQGDEDGELQDSKFNHPHSLCVDHSSNTCFVSDTFNHKVRVFFIPM